MEFRALGPVEVWSAGQRRDLGPAKLRSLLVMLLLTPKAVVPAETLIDRLWDERPPSKAREDLSVYIARLRATLRQAVGDSVRVAGRAQGGYQLEVDPEAVDLHRFRGLRRQATALAASGDFEHAVSLLHEADELWRGQALAGINGDWVARTRDALEEERRAAVLERVGYELELGRHAGLVGELRHLLAMHPFDETLIAHQMTALYRSGRPTDALSLYRQSRDLLVEEQGTEPGPMLSELHQRMLSRDPGLAARAADQHLAQKPTTLPPETVHFVGREMEIAALTGAAHDDLPVIAVIEGMPGVGKTTLALQAARLIEEQFPDGTLYLNLHSHDPRRPPLDPADALHRLLQMLSVPAAQIPLGIGERAALWQAHLSRRSAVVILDDAAGLDQIRPILPAAGRCLILITTRRALGQFAGARTLTLDVLHADEAMTLFRRIAGDGRIADADEVAAAVSLCGRLPLAIALTASRIGRDGPPSLGGLIEELSQPPGWPDGTGAANPGVIAAFDLSYRALEPDHQQFFRRLGLSPCAGLSLPAAAALGDCTLAQAEKALATLIDCHLLARGTDAQFRFHDLIGGYAAARAAQDDRQAAQRQAVRRLLDYYLHAADQADRLLHPFRRRASAHVTCRPADGPALATHEDAGRWLDSEWRNILQAARYAARHEFKQQCADLINLLTAFLEIRAYWDDAIAAHTVALHASRDLADPARIARALLALSSMRQQTGGHEAAIPLAEEAAAIYRSLGDGSGEAESLDQIGLAHQRTSRSREALAYFQEARNLYETAADPCGVADTLSHTGIACWHLGRYQEAYARLHEAHALYRDAADRRGVAKVLNNLGTMHLSNGYHRDALDAYQRSLLIFREIGGAHNQAILYQNIGCVQRYKGNVKEALAAYRKALGIFRETGVLPNEADALNDIGIVYQNIASYDEALIHHQKAQKISADIGNLSQQLSALRMIADTHRGSGRYIEALEHYQTALSLARQIGDQYEEGKILEGIGGSTLSMQRSEAARIAFRQALDIFERLGVPEAELARIRIETMTPAFAVRRS